MIICKWSCQDLLCCSQKKFVWKTFRKHVHQMDRSGGDNKCNLKNTTSWGISMIIAFYMWLLNTSSRPRWSATQMFYSWSPHRSRKYERFTVERTLGVRARNYSPTPEPQKRLSFGNLSRILWLKSVTSKALICQRNTGTWQKHLFSRFFKSIAYGFIVALNLFFHQVRELTPRATNKTSQTE